MAGRPDPALVFVEEAADLLIQLEAALLGLEETPDDPELVATAFRALHTIKGSGAMFGFEAVASFTHYLENAFERVRSGALAPTRALVDLTLAAKDHIRHLIENPTDADPRIGAALLERLAVLVGEPAPVLEAAVARPVVPAEPVCWRIRFGLGPSALERGVNPLLLLDELRSLGDCEVQAVTDRIPPLAELVPAHCHVAWEVRLTTRQPRQAIEDVFLFVDDEAGLTIEPVDTKPATGTNNSDAAPAAPAGAVAPRGGVAPAPAAPGTATAPALRPAAGVAEAKPAGNGGRSSTSSATAQPQSAGSVRVPAERLDELMDMVGELVIAEARLKQLVNGPAADPQIKAVAEEIERLSSGLRDITMNIRTVPIGSLFDRFRRLVRDLARDLDKTVVLSMAGGETELDKTVIERLNDPLVHLIRNALDHGIEDPEERLRAGKPADGHLQLSAVHSGTQVLVTVKDDGRGISAARLRAKAEDQGLIERGAVMSDSELYQLIFHPGLSTAEAVTNVSGRGVGMDVVKRTIDSLRGSIEVDSSPGEGTAVTLRLPLTLAIIDGLLVRVGTGRYVIPLSAVEECVELEPEVDQRRGGRSFLNIRGELVPFLRLRDVFNTAAPPDLYPKVVVVSTGDQRVGLVVDQVIGDHQTVIKSLSKLHHDVQEFSGATILGDGTVALILDVAPLINRGQAARPQRQAS
jgi:two-component system chemotaxis sensor kinase CheA